MRGRGQGEGLAARRLSGTGIHPLNAIDGHVWSIVPVIQSQPSIPDAPGCHLMATGTFHAEWSAKNVDPSFGAPSNRCHGLSPSPATREEGAGLASGSIPFIRKNASSKPIPAASSWRCRFVGNSASISRIRSRAAERAACASSRSRTARLAISSFAPHHPLSSETRESRSLTCRCSASISTLCGSVRRQ
jgi:hypothetical protein